jgi:cytochrome c-type biogenesis protein CcmH/NrfG
MARALTAALILLALALPACNMPQHSPAGVYQPFELWQEPVYTAEVDELTVYFKSQPLAGQESLPRDLTVGLTLAADDMQASVLPPGWFNNLPIMAISVPGVSYLSDQATITATVYQNDSPVQTMTLTFSPATQPPTAIINGTPAPPATTP